MIEPHDMSNSNISVKNDEDDLLKYSDLGLATPIQNCPRNDVSEEGENAANAVLNDKLERRQQARTAKLDKIMKKFEEKCKKIEAQTQKCNEKMERIKQQKALKQKTSTEANVDTIKANDLPSQEGIDPD